MDRRRRPRAVYQTPWPFTGHRPGLLAIARQRAVGTDY